MDATNEAIERVNAILLRHTEVETFAYAKAADSYDAKLRLRGDGLAILKMQGLSGFHRGSPNVHQMQLYVSDVRSDQHDRVRYEIADLLEDCALCRCQAITLIANGARIELL